MECERVTVVDEISRIEDSLASSTLSIEESARGRNGLVSLRVFLFGPLEPLLQVFVAVSSFSIHVGTPLVMSFRCNSCQWNVRLCDNRIPLSHSLPCSSLTSLHAHFSTVFTCLLLDDPLSYHKIPCNPRVKSLSFPGYDTDMTAREARIIDRHIVCL